MERNLCYQVPNVDEELDTNLYVPLLEMINKGAGFEMPTMMQYGDLKCKTVDPAI